MNPEDIVVSPSAENGNVSIETEPVAPSAEPTTPVTPTEPAEPVTPTEPVAQEELFELPDGRKVDAETLSKEWKENFYPDYTRKSQALAAKDAPITPPATVTTDEWAPQSWNEVIQKAKEDLKAEQLAEQQRAEQESQAIEEAVTSQLNEVKTKDPTVNENALFQHATKYGFRDLRHAHQNMKDMADAVKKTQTITADNIQKRTDPVSVTPGASGARPDPSQFENARDYLRSLK